MCLLAWTLPSFNAPLEIILFVCFFLSVTLISPYLLPNFCYLSHLTIGRQTLKHIIGYTASVAWPATCSADIGLNALLIVAADRQILGRYTVSGEVCGNYSDILTGKIPCGKKKDRGANQVATLAKRRTGMVGLLRLVRRERRCFRWSHRDDGRTKTTR